MIIPGERYERLAVATYATHDHEPIRAFWEQALELPSTQTGQQPRETLEKIALFAGLNSKIDQLDYEKHFYPAIMEALFSCNSWIAIVMITDLLARKYRFNVPGTKANLNWTRRIQRSIAKLRSGAKEQRRMRLIRELLEKAGRV
jgi:4-alpha-glucanotransferase